MSWNKNKMKKELLVHGKVNRRPGESKYFRELEER